MLEKRVGWGEARHFKMNYAVNLLTEYLIHNCISIKVDTLT